MKELESSIAEESSASSANSTTDDSTTDDSTLNEEADEHNERIDDQEPPSMVQAKANARLLQRNQVAKMKRQRRQQRPPIPSVCKNDNKFKYNGKIECKKIHKMKKIRRNKICNKKHKSKDETTNKRMKVKFYCPKACRTCKPSNKNKN